MVVGRRSSVIGGVELAQPRGFRDLDVYKASFALLTPIHELVRDLPDYEKWDLAQQMRRASKSIPANIAEGYALRDAPKLFCKHLRIAYGSAAEMRVHLDVAFELRYLAAEQHAELEGRYAVVAKQLFRLWQHWTRQLGIGADDD